MSSNNAIDRFPADTSSPLLIRSVDSMPFSVAIANGTSLTAAIDLGTARLVGLIMPAAWTAASITFQVSHDGVTFVDLYNSSGTAVVLNSPAASRAYSLDASLFIGWRHMKVRSGLIGAAVNQGADRTVILVANP